MEYLLGLHRDELPLFESDIRNIDKLRVLSAAGMVEVRLPPPDAPHQPAQVLYITGLGCATLRARSAQRCSAAPVVQRELECSAD
ncbi:hypothetical protein ACOQFS_08285 [Paracidovorax sp. MALMAid1276]